MSDHSVFCEVSAIAAASDILTVPEKLLSIYEITSCTRASVS